MEQLRSAIDVASEWGLGFIAIWVAVYFASRLLQRWLNPESGAKKIHADAKALYSGPHEFAEVQTHAFRWADHRYYDETEAALSALGFRKLGDVEDVTTSRVYPSMRTFIRTMTGDGGRIAAGIFHVKMRGWMRPLVLYRLLPGNLRSVDLETELSDGTFVATGKSLGKDLSSKVAGIDRLDLPDATPLADLLAAHREHLTQILGERPNVVAQRIETLADDFAMQNRMQELKNRQQAAKNFVDLEQFDRCSAGTAGKDPDEVSAEIRGHLARLGAEERAGAER